MTTRSAVLDGEIKNLIRQLDELTNNAKNRGDSEVTAEEFERFEKMYEDVSGKQEELKKLKSNDQMLADLKASIGDIEVKDLDTKSGSPKTGQRKSAGEMFTENDFFKAWHGKANFDSNSPLPEMHGIPVGGMKDIISSGGTGPASPMVREDWRGLVDTGTFMRPLSFYDMVTKSQTTSDLITFAKITGYTNNAAPVPEAAGIDPYVAGAGQVQGLKPNSNLVIEEDDTRVVTIAHGFILTRRALRDVAMLRNMVDTFIRYGLEEEREDQMVNGDGTGENLLGVLNTSGTQSQAWDTNLLVTTRKAITKIRTVGRGRPTAFLLSPSDNERFDLLTDANGQFYFGGPSQIGEQKLLWGLPRIECEAIPDGTGLLADWRWWVAFDREAATVRVSEHHKDFFMRNLVQLLGEFSMGFAGYAPIKTIEIDLTA